MIGEGCICPDDMPDISAHEEGVIALDYEVPEAGKCYLKLEYHLKNATRFLPEGFKTGL